MDYEVLGMAHIGCTVSNLRESVSFLQTVLGFNKVRIQYTDYPYLSGVIGIPGSAIEIGFVQKDDGQMLECLNYTHKNSVVQDGDFSTIGNAYVSCTVDSFAQVYGACRQNADPNITVLEEASTITYGKYAGAQHFFVQACGVVFEILEANEVSVVKTGFVVSDVGQSAAFFGHMGLQVEETFALTKNGQAYSGAVLTGANSALQIELLQPQAPKRYGQAILPDMTGNVHCCFHVRGIQPFWEALLGHGATAQGAITTVTHGINAGAQAGYMNAPDGIKLELFQGKPTAV